MLGLLGFVLLIIVLRPLAVKKPVPTLQPIRGNWRNRESLR